MSPTTIFVLILFATLIIGGLFRPILGILGYLSIYIIYDYYAWWCQPIKPLLLYRPSLVASIFLIIGCILHRDKLDWCISRREIEFYLFLGTAWIVSFSSGIEMHAGTWKYLDKILRGFVFIFFLLRVVNTLDHFKLLVWGYILGAIFLSYQAHTMGYFVAGRLENIGGIDFNEANSLAAFLAITMILLSFELLKGPLWRKILCVIGIAAMFDSIVLTQSRAVFLGLALTCPYVLFSAPKVYRKQIYLYLVLGVIMALILMSEHFITRVATIDDETNKIGSTDTLVQEEGLSRIDYWKASLRIFADHPFGVGVNNFHKIVPYYDPRNPGKDAHNTFVSCYSEIGIIGIILFVTIILKAFFQLKRIRQMAINTPYEVEIMLFSVALATSLIAYILGGMMTHNYLYLERTWMLLALPICLENAARKLLAESASPLTQENV